MGSYSTQSYFCDPTNSNVSRTDVALAVNCCGIAKVVQGQCINPSKRRDIYLIYMICGELTANLGGNEYVLLGGDLICIPAETNYYYRCTSAENVRYFWIHFTGADASDVLEATGISPLTRYSASDASVNAELYEVLFSEFRSRHRSFVYRTALILRNILMRLASQVDEDVQQKNALDSSIRYIHTHLGADLSVKELAKRNYLSEGYYRVLFKSITGVSPSEYIAEQRINRACQLLTETAQSIDSISSYVGINDRLYFQRFFKKHTGVTPAQYRLNATEANKKSSE